MKYSAAMNRTSANTQRFPMFRRLLVASLARMPPMLAGLPPVIAIHTAQFPEMKDGDDSNRLTNVKRCNAREVFTDHRIRAPIRMINKLKSFFKSGVAIAGCALAPRATKQKRVPARKAALSGPTSCARVRNGDAANPVDAGVILPPGEKPVENTFERHWASESNNSNINNPTSQKQVGQYPEKVTLLGRGIGVALVFRQFGDDERKTRLQSTRPFFTNERHSAIFISSPGTRAAN